MMVLSLPCAPQTSVKPFPWLRANNYGTYSITRKEISKSLLYIYKAEKTRSGSFSHHLFLEDNLHEAKVALAAAKQNKTSKKKLDELRNKMLSCLVLLRQSASHFMLALSHLLEAFRGLHDELGALLVQFADVQELTQEH